MIKISQAQYDDAVARLLGREKVADAMSRRGLSRASLPMMAQDPLAIRAMHPGALLRQGGPSPVGAFSLQAAPNLPGGMVRPAGRDTSHLMRMFDANSAPVESLAARVAKLKRLLSRE